MGYLLIDDFSLGVDRRKSNVTARPGSLRTLRNAYITAGGEIEKRKTFTSIGTLPAGTHGVGFVGGQVKVFGTGSFPGGLPANVGYQQLSIGGGLTISRVLDVTRFGTKGYIIARMSDNSIEQFFDGANIAAMSDQGTAARAHKTKMYVADGNNLRFSTVADPADWAGTGSGLIDVTTQDSGMADLVGIEQYYNQLALMGRNTIQVWMMDPDPAQNTLIQSLDNIGLVAPNGLARYGNGDVLFLSQSGIRSLRARDSSNAAVLNDIGSPIDSIIAAKRALLTPDEAEKIMALVDPLTGHFWLIWKNEVHVLSYYPNSKVTAWSSFDLPWEVDAAALANQRLVLRAGNELFIYGSVPGSGSPLDPNVPLGVSEALYDDTPAEIITPMIDLGKPATKKTWGGIDLSVEGLWDVYVSPDYNNPTAWTKIATVDKPTFGDERIPIDMTSTHICVRLVSTNDGPAKVSSLMIHHDLGDDS